MQDAFRRVDAGQQIFRSENDWEAFAKGYSATNAKFVQAHGRQSLGPEEGEAERRFRRSVIEGVVWMECVAAV